MNSANALFSTLSYMYDALVISFKSVIFIIKDLYNDKAVL